MNTLYYVHDPMCSWCWGFKPTLETLEAELPSTVGMQRVLGGLAPDTDDPMPESMQTMLQQTWQRIEQAIPSAKFNYNFWTENTPRRATYPACRAVIAATAQDAEFETPMITGIQHAYYLQAQNPSNDDTLANIAQSIGCNKPEFEKALNSEQTKQQFKNELSLSAQLGAQGFPSLILVKDEQHAYRIPTDYVNSSSMISNIEAALAS